MAPEVRHRCGYKHVTPLGSNPTQDIGAHWPVAAFFVLVERDVDFKTGFGA